MEGEDDELLSLRRAGGHAGRSVHCPSVVGTYKAMSTFVRSSELHSLEA